MKYKIRQSENRVLWYVEEDSGSIVKVFWEECKAVKYLEHSHRHLSKEDRLIELREELKRLEKELKYTDTELF